MRRRVAWAALVLVLLAAAAVGGGGVWLRGRLRASLPILDGRITVAHLQLPVSVTRDGLGIPTIRALSREDVARVTGFLHAQDRFFQMDLARRRAAGELSELVGPRALPVDRLTRLHRFRAVTRRAVATLPANERRILTAYVEGVNAGLAQLGAPPFEYLLLRQTPRPWSEEDSLLVVLSMFLTLQDSEGLYDATLATMTELLPPAMVDFLVPRGSEWDSPVEGDTYAVPPIPGPEIYNLRQRRTGRPEIVLPAPRPEPVQLPTPNDLRWPNSQLAMLAVLGGWGNDGRWELGAHREESAVGSNNFAVSGRLTSTGASLVANDMHLGVRVPNTWYRAVYVWVEERRQGVPGDREERRPGVPGDREERRPGVPGDREERRPGVPGDSDPSGASHMVVGATLPGHPAMVIGSNTNVAWGFTNTYGDFTDIVSLEIDPQRPDWYRTSTGWQRFEHYDEAIKVAGEADDHVAVTWTIWGPVIDPDHDGRPRALRWVAHSLDQLDNRLTPFESVATLEELFDEANGAGAPAQNMVAADRRGRIGWSIFGAAPRRMGFEGDRPISWADGAAGWNGWLADSDYPRIIDPADGRIWTANARVAGGAAERTLGHANYEIGSRARIIRDRLMARDRFTAHDLLDVQLDISATFLSRWRDLALKALAPEALRTHPDRAEFRSVVERNWTGEVTADSAAYRLTRMFRERVSEHVFGFLLSECYEKDGAFDYRTIRLREGPIWKVVTEQPIHLLDPAFANWQQLLLTSVDEVIALVRQDHSGPLAERTWGEFNRTMYRHPLSGALPFMYRWLDMPDRPLPGDLYTPNMHWGANAPSERMIVSPGRESEGIMHMPTGQSGHPLSPFYGNSHDAWVNGEATPLMPGPVEHLLTLTP